MKELTINQKIKVLRNLKRFYIDTRVGFEAKGIDIIAETNEGFDPMHFICNALINTLKDLNIAKVSKYGIGGSLSVPKIMLPELYNNIVNDIAFSGNTIKGECKSITNYPYVIRLDIVKHTLREVYKLKKGK